MVRRPSVRAALALSFAFAGILAAPSSSFAGSTCVLTTSGCVATTATTPTTTTAAAPVQPLVGADYHGYATFDAQACSLNLTGCTSTTAPAWTETKAGAWVLRGLADNATLYVCPWTAPRANKTGWHWAYSYADRLWFAVPSSQLRLYRAK